MSLLGLLLEQQQISVSNAKCTSKGPNLKPPQAPFKTLLVSSFRKMPEFTARTLATSFMDVSSDF